jgi:hypothetical protein
VVTTENDSLDDGTPRDHVASPVPSMDQYIRAQLQQDLRKPASAYVLNVELAAQVRTMAAGVRCRHSIVRRGQTGLWAGPESRGWWIYVVEVLAEDRPVKIGVADDIEKRLGTLQGSVPFPLRVIALARGCRDLEGKWHVQHRAHRRNGEWFGPEVGVIFREAMAAAPVGGCARCVLLGDQFVDPDGVPRDALNRRKTPRVRKVKPNTHHAAERQQASEQ